MSLFFRLNKKAEGCSAGVSWRWNFGQIQPWGGTIWVNKREPQANVFQTRNDAPSFPALFMLSAPETGNTQPGNFSTKLSFNLCRFDAKIFTNRLCLNPKYLIKIIKKAANISVLLLVYHMRILVKIVKNEVRLFSVKSSTCCQFKWFDFASSAIICRFSNFSSSFVIKDIQVFRNTIKPRNHKYRR